MLQNILKEFQFRIIQFHSVLSGNHILIDLGILLLTVQRYKMHKYKKEQCWNKHKDYNFSVKENFTLKM